MKSKDSKSWSWWHLKFVVLQLLLVSEVTLGDDDVVVEGISVVYVVLNWLLGTISLVWIEAVWVVGGRADWVRFYLHEFLLFILVKWLKLLIFWGSAPGIDSSVLRQFWCILVEWLKFFVLWGSAPSIISSVLVKSIWDSLIKSVSSNEGLIGNFLSGWGGTPVPGVSKSLLSGGFMRLGINDVMVKSKVWNSVVHWVSGSLLWWASSTGADWVTGYLNLVLENLGSISLMALE